MPRVFLPTQTFIPPAPAATIADDHNQEGWTPLHLAAYNNQQWFFAQLATHETINASDSLGRTPLHLAALQGHQGAVYHLLIKGAEVDAPDNKGWTAAHHAAKAGHTDVIKVLFNQLANLDAEASDHTRPLDLSYRKGHLETIQVLLDCGATVSEAEDVFLEPDSQLRRPY